MESLRSSSTLVSSELTRCSTWQPANLLCAEAPLLPAVKNRVNGSGKVTWFVEREAGTRSYVCEPGVDAPQSRGRWSRALLGSVHPPHTGGSASSKSCHPPHREGREGKAARRATRAQAKRRGAETCIARREGPRRPPLHGGGGRGGGAAAADARRGGSARQDRPGGEGEPRHDDRGGHRMR